MDHKVHDTCMSVVHHFHKWQPHQSCFIHYITDSGGMPDRPCTLTGSQEAVGKAKDLVEKIISRAQGMGDGMGMDGHMSMMNETARIEVMIPGNKVGLVIGKGGETIRQLQVNSF